MSTKEMLHVSPEHVLHTYITLHTHKVCRQDEEEPIHRASSVALLRHYLSLIRKERKKERKIY
jgi:hypothetical protein